MDGRGRVEQKGHDAGDLLLAREAVGLHPRRVGNGRGRARHTCGSAPPGPVRAAVRQSPQQRSGLHRARQSSRMRAGAVRGRL